MTRQIEKTAVHPVNQSASDYPGARATQQQEDRYERGAAMVAAVDGPAGMAVVETLAKSFPDLARLVVEFPFGDIYARPGSEPPQTSTYKLPSYKANSNEFGTFTLTSSQALYFVVKGDKLGVNSKFTLNAYQLPQSASCQTSCCSHRGRSPRAPR